jgi:pyruvate kinase
VRIMVTLPAAAAGDFGLARQMVQAGMDIARINCAHDDAAAWAAMAANIRRAARIAGRPVKILMDRGGPKLRTGPIAAGPAVLKLRSGSEPTPEQSDHRQRSLREDFSPRAGCLLFQRATKDRPTTRTCAREEAPYPQHVQRNCG